MKSREYLNREAKFEGAYDAKVLQTLKLIYTPFKYSMVFLFFAGFAGRLALLSVSNLVGLWVDSYCKGQDCKRSYTFADWHNADFAIAILTVTVVGLIFTILFRVGFSRISARAVSLLYDEVTFRTSRFPSDFFDRNPVGRIITRFSTDYGNVFRIFGGPLSEFVSLLFDLVVIFILVGFANPIFFPIFLLLAVAHTLVYRSEVNRLRLERREHSRLRGPSISHFAETVQGASLVRVFGRRSSFESRFNDLDRLFQDQKLKLVTRMQLFSVKLSLVTASGLGAVGVTALWGVSRGHLSVGSVGVAFGMVALVGQTIQMFFEWLSQLEESLTGVERLSDYLHRPIEKGSRLPTGSLFYLASASQDSASNATVRTSGIGSEKSAIQFSDVHFRYLSGTPWVLNKINLEIPHGQHVGVIGRTGSGKSSLINLISALYPVQEGRISIGAHSTEMISPTNSQDLLPVGEFRRLVSQVSQESILLSGTLRENLDPYSQRTDQELLGAMESVGLMDWFLRQSEGLGAIIQERGGNISSGEKQLICLARALVARSKVIIFDEATSHVDPQTELLIGDAANRFFAQHTRVTIAHRLSTVRNCDRIIWIEKGMIRADGTPSNVIQEFESFRRTLPTA